LAAEVKILRTNQVTASAAIEGTARTTSEIDHHFELIAIHAEGTSNRIESGRPSTGFDFSLIRSHDWRRGKPNETVLRAN